MVVGLVDRSVDLRGRSLPVDCNAFALDGKSRAQNQRAVDAVDLDLMGVFAVGEFCDACPHGRLGPFLHGGEERRGVINSNVVQELKQAALRHLHRQQLCVEITQHLFGEPYVSQHQRDDVLVELPTRD